MKRLALFCAITCVLFPLCAGGKADASAGSKAEDRLFAAQKGYPDEDYFSAIGSGNARATAESNAKLALSQILGESISGSQVTTQYADSLGREEGSIASVVNERAVFDHITGIVIKETAVDTATGTTYALAVLNRKEAGNYYFSQVNDANAQVSSLLGKAGASRGKIESMQHLNDALALAVENEYNVNLLSVISPAQARVVRAAYQSPQQIRTRRAELASALRVWVHLDGRDADEDCLSKARLFLSARLSGQGISVVPETDSAATHGIYATLSFDPADSNDPQYHFVRYTFNAVIREFSTGKEVPYAVSGREGHLSLAQAKTRSLSKIENDIKDNFPL